MTRTSSEHLVHPRWVWSGTLLALLGLVGLSVAVMVLSWTWAVGGVLVASVGGVVAWRGGVLYDGRARIRGEAKQVAHGGTHEGVAPGDTLSGPAASRDAAAVERRRRGLEQLAASGPRRPDAGPAGVGLVLVTLFLTVGQWELYPLERPGQDNAVRALGAAIVLGAAGLRMLNARRQAHGVAGAVTVVVGCLLLANAVLAPHEVVATAGAEAVCGALAIGCGLAVIVAATRARGQDR